MKKSNFISVARIPLLTFSNIPVETLDIDTLHHQRQLLTAPRSACGLRNNTRPQTRPPRLLLSPRRAAARRSTRARPKPAAIYQHRCEIDACEEMRGHAGRTLRHDGTTHECHSMTPRLRHRRQQSPRTKDTLSSSQYHSPSMLIVAVIAV